MDPNQRSTSAGVLQSLSTAISDLQSFRIATHCGSKNIQHFPCDGTSTEYSKNNGMQRLVICFAKLLKAIIFSNVSQQILQIKYSSRNRIRVSPHPQFCGTKIRFQYLDPEITADPRQSADGSAVRTSLITTSK